MTAKMAIQNLLDQEEKLKMVMTALMLTIVKKKQPLNFNLTRKLIFEFTRGVSYELMQSREELEERYEELDVDKKGVLEFEVIYGFLREILEQVVKEME